MATWIVRAGSDDEYLAECLSSNFVAIGWQEVRRQTLIKDIDFNDIYHKLQEIYPSDSNHTIGAYTSQIHAFANKIYGGDFVLIPSGKGKKISVGYLLGERVAGSIDKYLLPIVAAVILISMVPIARELLKKKRD